MPHIYCKQGAEVAVSSRFLYLEEIYLSSHNQWALYRSQKYKSKVPIKCENTIRYSKNIVVVFIDIGNYLVLLKNSSLKMDLNQNYE